MNELDHTLIERYLRGELDEAEHHAIEVRMAADEAFRLEVELHARALAAVNFQGLNDLKKRLQQREEAHGLQKKKRQRRFWGLVLLVLTIGLVLVYWFWAKMKSEPQNDQPAQKVPTNREELESKKSIQPNTSPEKQVSPPPQGPIAQQKSSPQQLFAAAFQAYQDASLNPNVRDEQNPSPFEQFLQHYWEKQYDQTLQAFEKLEPALQTNDDVLFLKANALLATGQTKTAATLFEGILARGESRFVDQAAWYLALCSLENGDLVQTKKQLKKLLAHSNTPRRSDAQRLLEQLR